MIYDVKDDPIIQDSSQEPSTSSKYELWGLGVLDTLLVMLDSWNLKIWEKTKIQSISGQSMMSKMIPSSRLQSGTFNILKVWTSRMEGSWHTSNYARELRFGNKSKSHIMMKTFRRFHPNQKKNGFEIFIQTKKKVFPHIIWISILLAFFVTYASVTDQFHWLKLVLGYE